jgi:CO/xanthine dehydrogenase FAD-binding subunit
MTEKKMQYKRPASLAEALLLKQEFGDHAKFLFGGNFQPKLEENLEVLIDLQDSGLDEVEWNESGLRVGGLTTLKSLEENLGLADFGEALSIEFGLNVRNSLSLSNFLAHTNGRSPVLCCLLALGAKVLELNQPNLVSLFDYVTSNRQNRPVIEMQLPAQNQLAFDSVGRSPKDLPIVCVAVGSANDGEINVAVGGTVEIKPGFKMLNLDDDGQDGIIALLAGAEDEWASAEYRQEVGGVLLSRTLQKLHLQAGNQEAK